MTVNGTSEEHDVEPRLLLVHYLREVLGLTGTNVGCDTTSCGACTVLIAGESVKSCTMLAVQQAFQDNHGLQCGFCTPGMVMAISSFLVENPDPTEAEVRVGLEGNLCRCTGYHNIVRAALAAARAPELSSWASGR